KTSLREALNLVNSAVGTSNTVNFDPTLFGSAQTITLTLGELPINSSVIINQTGVTKANTLTVNGNAGGRVFHLATASSITVNMSGMTITGGSNTSQASGILVGSTDSITMDGIWLTGNSGTGAGGGMSVDTVLSPSTSVITVTNSTISGNSGATAGAIYFLRGTQIF